MQETSKKIQEVDAILEELNGIYLFLKEVPDPDNGHELSVRLTGLGAYMARLSFIASTAKFMCTEAKAEIMKKRLHAINDLKSTVAPKYIDALTPTEDYVYEIADRLFKVCDTQVGLLRTLIASRREEMKNSLL